MKVILLGDTHLGARSGSPIFSEYFNVFFSEVLYPYMKENGISQIFQLGDLFDNRTALPLKAFDASKEIWFDALAKNNFRMHVLLGNHDITLKESLRVNTPESVLADYIKAGNIVVYKEPTELQVGDNCTFDVIPWICKENIDTISSFMSRDKVSEICIGHFAIEGAMMYRGVQGHGGINQEKFERYERVFSGHYHTRSELMDGKIQYVGTPYEITWMDAHDPRGFTVFDTDTRKFEFVPNPSVLHEKILYTGSKTSVPTNLTGKYVKIVVESKDDVKKFDSFRNSIELQNPVDVVIMENLDAWKDGVLQDEKIDIDDTITVISKYIDSLDTTLPKDRMKEFINGLYTEAISS